MLTLLIFQTTTKVSKVVGPFPGPCASGSYMHRAALFYIVVLKFDLYSFCVLSDSKRWFINWMDR
jgi:hypothetical protein